MRKVVVQKENEKLLQVQQDRHAELQREKIKKDTIDFISKGTRLEVADMHIAYDLEGKIMRVKQPNLDKHPNLNKPHSFVRTNIS